MRGDLHKAEAEALAKRMIESVRRKRERQAELSTDILERKTPDPS